MAASNHRPRISLQFNDFDFRHRKVLEILRARPRNMTDLVVNAVLHFISCPNAEQEYDNGSLGACPPAAEPDEPEVDPDLGDMMAAFRNQS